MNVPPPIVSERLSLMPLTLAFHRAALARDGAAAEAALGLAVPPGILETVPARRRARQLEADPDELPWLVRAMVLRDERRVVGHIGFHERPDGAGRGEVGYTVLPAERRRGYAREALVALTDWGHREGGVRICVASISPDNGASLGLVRGLGFVRVGEAWDDEDGLELVFEHTLPLPRARAT